MPARSVTLDCQADARLTNAEEFNWADARGDENTSASSLFSAETFSTVGPFHIASGRGSGYGIHRMFFLFNVVSIEPGVTITKMDFFVKSTAVTVKKLIPVASTNTAGLTNSDYGSIFPTLTAYHAAQVINSTSGSTLSLNSSAISDLHTQLGTGGPFRFTIALIGENDYGNSAPGSDVSDYYSVYTVDHGTSGNRPTLTIDYEYNTTFFGANF